MDFDEVFFSALGACVLDDFLYFGVSVVESLEDLVGFLGLEFFECVDGGFGVKVFGSGFGEPDEAFSE